MDSNVKPIAPQTIASRLRLLAEKVRREIDRFGSRRAGRLLGRQPVAKQTRKRPRGGRVSLASESLLRDRYANSPARMLPDTFVLYRIIGNDLVPRHAAGQSRGNVAFILKHEPEFEDCEKRWVLNRILDPTEEAAIIDLLESHDQQYLRIPFDLETYQQVTWDTAGLPSAEYVFSKSYQKMEERSQQLVQLHLRRHKSIYAINNNGARNAALYDGRGRAKWVLPFDGNCYFTRESFGTLSEKIKSAPWHPYVIVPMARINDNEQLLIPGFQPLAEEEPQIVFRTDANEAFDNRVPYGRRPKVELLWRLGVPGPWDKYKFCDWDFKRPPVAAEAGHFQTAGWVARLASGRPDLEIGQTGFVDRGSARGESIIATLDRLDAAALRTRSDVRSLAFYDPHKIRDLSQTMPTLAASLRQQADLALTQGPYSVTQKSTRAPSGNWQDYWHPAPYWWPDPAKADGLPYVWRDGQRVPGTRLYDAQSDRFDRTRLQRMLDETTILAIAGEALGGQSYFEHAGRLIRSWFLDPSTRMNPHLEYAQVRCGHNGDVGAGTGIIEFKDLYFFLDAVRMLRSHAVLSPNEMKTFSAWLDQYANWLTTSPAGANECRSTNNHGTFYEVQVLAIAAFLEDFDLAAKACNRARLRLFGQFGIDGSQPHELNRSMPRHYVAFGLAGWTTVSRLAGRFGIDFWQASDAEGRSLEHGFEWLLNAWPDRGWSGGELTELPAERLDPLWQDCRDHYPQLATRLPVARPTAHPILCPDFGFAPYWMLSRS